MMKAQRIGTFSLKQKDFASGRLVSPPRDQWHTCDCCGLKIVQGVELSNGHRIGNDCEEVRWRVQNLANCMPERLEEEAAKLFSMFGTKRRIQNYVLGLVE